MPIFFIVLTILSNIYFSITLLNNHFVEDTKLTQEHEIALQKLHIKNQIDSMYNYIEHKKTESLIRLKKRLKDRVYTGYEIIEKIYEEKKDLLSSSELQKDIFETLRKVRYGKDGYYFILNIKNEHEIVAKMAPATVNVEEKNVFSFKDDDNNFYIQKFAKTVTHNKNHEGYVEYKWFKLTEKERFRKISFVKGFQPYNWIIGYGEYFDDFEKDIKKEALQRLDLFRYKDNGYIFTHNTNYTLLQHPYRQNDIGHNDKDLIDKEGTKIIQQFVRKALENKDGSFVEYYWNKPDQTKFTKKLGYVKLIPQWNWVIGTGVYIDDIKVSFEKIKKVKEHAVSKSIIDLLIISAIILIASILISLLISKKINKIFLKYQLSIKEKQEELELANNSLELKVEEKTKELKYLNEELENKIHKRVLELKQKDKQLLEQSKMVALGEMIGNIAHQWRQPLSAITVSASGIKLKKQLDLLEDDELIHFTDEIMNNSKYLSQVIEDFKNYIKEDKVKSKFNINSSIEKSLSITQSSIKNNNLTLSIKKEEEIYIENYQNELVQALVNIINNAKDALIENVKEEEHRLIFIDTYKRKGKAVICIKNTGGGISSEILPKIFEPYFTTKEKNIGTGLGLYMTYKIIVDSMKGKIEVDNKEIIYNDKVYKGVEFKIILDI